MTAGVADRVEPIVVGAVAVEEAEELVAGNCNFALDTAEVDTAEVDIAEVGIVAGIEIVAEAHRYGPNVAGREIP